MRRLCGWLVVFAALALSASAAPGTPEGITLRLQDVTLAEAAAAVSRAAGVRVELAAVQISSPLAAAARASFNWAGDSLDTVLRELCARFQRGCVDTGGGYLLPAAAAGRPSPHVFTKDGLRLTLAGIALSHQRPGTGPQVPRPGEAIRARSSLYFEVDLDADRADWEARLESVLAVDDLGREVRAPGYGGRLSKSFPSQRQGSLHLTLPDARSSRLTRLEGTLVLTKRAPRRRLSIPYPAPGERVERRVEPELVLAASQARPAAPTPAQEHPDAPAAPLEKPMFEAEEGPSILLRAYRTGERRAGAEEFFPAPRAVGRSGRLYPGRSGGGGGSTRPGESLYYSTVSFPGAEEPLERLKWETQGAPGAGFRLHFRLDDIQLPRLDALPVLSRWGSGLDELPTSPPPPISRRGGASLCSQVSLAGTTVPKGELRIGLAAPAGEGWGPFAWCRVPIEPGGRARLEGVAPGRYRVARQYVLTRGPIPIVGARPGSPAGRWLNSEVEVVVPASGAVELPPLELSPAPAARAAREPGPLPADGLTTSVDRVSSTHGRAVRWSGSGTLTSHENGEVSITASHRAGDAARPGVVFVRTVFAADDRGTILAGRQDVPYFGNPDWTRLNFRLSSAHPEARQLRWVEGALYAYRRKRRVRIEMPYPSGPRSVLARESDRVLAVAADEIPTARPPADQQPRDLIPEDVAARKTPPTIRYRLCYRDGVLQSGRQSNIPSGPAAIGRSGAVYQPRGGGGQSTEVHGWVLHAMKAAYPDAREPLVKLVWEFELWDSPESLGHFRMRDVPLPDPTLLAQVPPPNPAPPPAAIAPTQAAPRPAAGGGKLLVRGLRDGRPTAEGSVHFGLARRTESGWGPRRWTEELVSDRGVARLEGMPPGRYRLTLRHELNDGRGQGVGPVEITLVEGKELELPPFHLAPARPKR